MRMSDSTMRDIPPHGPGWRGLLPSQLPSAPEPRTTHDDFWVVQAAAAEQISRGYCNWCGARAVNVYCSWTCEEAAAIRNKS